MENLHTYPKKLLIHFLQKHPHFQSTNLSRKKTDELVELILLNDVLCDWDKDSYTLAKEKLVRDKCKELQAVAEKHGIIVPKTIYKSKTSMIDFLVGDIHESISVERIKDCLFQQENISLTAHEIHHLMKN